MTIRIILFICVLLSSNTLAKASDALIKPRAAYENALKGYQDKHQKNLKLWPGEYIKACGKLKGNLQKQGDLEGVLAVNAEIKRFDKEGYVDSEQISKSVKELAVIQKRFIEIKEKMNTDKHKSVKNLADNYAEHLEKLQVKLTKAGQLEDALACKKEIDRVRNSDDVTQAAFEMALLDNPQPVKPKPDAASADNRPEGAADTTAVEAFEKDGFVVHEPGRLPPKPESGIFKRVTMRATGHADSRRVVSCYTTMNDKAQVTDKNSSQWSSTRTNEEATTARLKIKTSSNSTILEKPSIVIQYFATATSKWADKTPKESAFHMLELPQLDSNTLYIDCPVFVMRTSEWESTWDGGGDAHGQKYSGIIVSVFDKDKKLVFQEGSTTSLKDLARKDRPNSPTKQDWANTQEHMRERMNQIVGELEEAREDAERLRDRAKADRDNHELRKDAEKAAWRVRRLQEERGQIKWKLEQHADHNNDREE